MDTSDTEIDDTVVVIDNGSCVLKAGLAGDKTCKVVLNNAVGRPIYQKCTYEHGTTKKRDHSLIGYNSEHPAVNFTYPVKNGIVTNWDNMEEIWRYVFMKELNILPEECTLLITEVPHNPKSNREIMAGVLFEKFHTPSLYIAWPAALCMYSLVHITGLYLDIGEGVTYALPIYKGYILKHAVTRCNYGGADITYYLQKLIHQKGFTGLQFTGSDRIVKNIKEKYCRVMCKEDEERNETVCDLPDGETLDFDNGCYTAPEVLFNPSLVGSSEPGIHNIIYNVIKKCDYDIQEDLLNNIMLCGSTTFTKGLKQRLYQELKALFPSFISKIKIIAAPERNKAAWLGGSVLGGLACFSQCCVSKKDYEEFGYNIVQKKFL